MRLAGIRGALAALIAFTLIAAPPLVWAQIQPGGGGTTSAPSIVSIIGGGNLASVNASNQLAVNCANCSGSGVSQQDNTGFVYGSGNMVPIGCVYSTSVTSITGGNAGAVGCTAKRAQFVNLQSGLGVEEGNALTPLFVTVSPTLSVTTGAADESAFTAGSTTQLSVGGFFQTTATSNALTTGQAGAFQVTANRALFVNLRSGLGVEEGNALTPIYATISPTATVSLSSPNIQISNTPTVSLSSPNVLIANTPTVSLSSPNVLVAGVATAANQTTMINTLANISASVASSIPGGTNVIGGVTFPVNTTPTDCSSTITSSSVAQNAFTAQTTLHGFTIANIDTAAGSGEPMWISFTTTASPSTVGSYPLAAPTATTFAGLSSFTAPSGYGLNHALSVVAVTAGDKYSCTWW
jgi:hypothetical protein